MTDFPEIGYGTVHGRFLAGVLDDKDPVVNPTPPGFEPEVAPDAEPLSGYVTFSATAPVVRVVGAVPAPATLFPQSLRVYLDDEGYLSRDGSRDITLWATDDPDGNPVNWQWRVTFSLDHKGHGVYHAPFNFELPTDAIVDLTVVAPLVTPSPGTIIIQGPEGPAGPGVTDLITAKGDMVAGTGPQAAAIIHVGADGEYLTPDPAAETGLAWKPLPEGIKRYATLAEVELVRTAEVGILHVDNMAAAFPNLAAVGSGVEGVFGTGPADLVITTVMLDETDARPFPADAYVVYQWFEVSSSWGYSSSGDQGYGPTWTWRIQRSFTGKAGLNEAGHPWLPEPNIPKAFAGSVVYSVDGVNWGSRPAIATPNPNTVIQRDAEGQAQVADPTDPLDIANKGYVDAAIGAIPPAEGIKHYATIEEAMAVRVAEVGILHVDSVIAAFPQVDPLSPVWGSAGPGEFIFETSFSQSASDVDGLGTPVTYWQRVSGMDKSTGLWSIASRYFTTPLGAADDTGNQFTLNGQVLPKPLNNYVVYGGSGKWGTRAANSGAGASTVMIRDGAGQAQVNDPSDPLDIVNKQTLEATVAAIPGGVTEPQAYGTAVVKNWSSATPYNPGTIVLHNGEYWVALVRAVTVEPGTPGSEASYARADFSRYFAMFDAKTDEVEWAAFHRDPDGVVYKADAVAIASVAHVKGAIVLATDTGIMYRAVKDTHGPAVTDRNSWRPIAAGFAVMPTDAQAGYVLTAEVGGNAEWKPYGVVQGVGSPLGIVTPPASGSLYVDSARTNGADVWVARGTTITAWVVLVGDTGWRNVTPADVAPLGLASGQIAIRRINNEVILRGNALFVLDTVKHDRVWPLPAGFGSGGPNTDNRMILVTTDAPTEAGKVYGQVGLREANNTQWWFNTVANNLSFRGEWQTSLAWPDILPGNPIS